MKQTLSPARDHPANDSVCSQTAAKEPSRSARLTLIPAVEPEGAPRAAGASPGRCNDATSACMHQSDEGQAVRRLARQGRPISKPGDCFLSWTALYVDPSVRPVVSSCHRWDRGQCLSTQRAVESKPGLSWPDMLPLGKGPAGIDGCALPQPISKQNPAKPNGSRGFVLHAPNVQIADSTGSVTTDFRRGGFSMLWGSRRPRWLEVFTITQRA